MLSENNLKAFNTNIEDYSITELTHLLELDELSRESVILKVHDLNTNIFMNDEAIKAFFMKAQNKLLNYLNTSDAKLDYYLHNNANNNIETNIITDSDDDSYEGNGVSNSVSNSNNVNVSNNVSNSNIETFVNYSTASDSATPTTQIPIPLPSATSSKESLPINSDIIETYNIHKNLYFNTSYRSNRNIETSLPTDSKILLPNTITNVIQCKLTSLNIRKPFLIHTTKANNIFIIKKYNTLNIIDFSFSLLIDNGYYEDMTEMEDFLNNKFATSTVYSSENVKDTSNTTFVNAINFSINKNSKKCTFDLSGTSLAILENSNFKYYEIDFITNYISPYSLATILGFNNTKYNTSNNSINNYKIVSPKTYNTLSNPIYFCFSENQNAILETHQLFLNNNQSSDKILAKINTYKGAKKRDYYIYEILDNNDNKNNVRQYSGPINLSDFSIKIIDNYGLLVQSIQEEFTFDLELVIQATKLITNKV